MVSRGELALALYGLGFKGPELTAAITKYADGVHLVGLDDRLTEFSLGGALLAAKARGHA